MKKTKSFGKFGKGWDSDTQKVKQEKQFIGYTENIKPVQEKKAIIIYKAKLWIML